MEGFCWQISLAGVTIRMELQEPVAMTDPFRPFLAAGVPDYTAKFRRVETLPEYDDRVL